MQELKIKPFSINSAWRGGRRFRTNEYNAFIEEIGWLTKGHPKFTGKKMLTLEIKIFLNSIVKSDVDNFIKTLVDSLVKNGIIEDDRYIKKIVIEKFRSDYECIQYKLSE